MSLNIINPYQTFRDSAGQVRANGIVTFYVNSTTTLAAIFSDEALTVTQSNPYTLDAFGRITGDVKYSGVMTLKIQNADLSDVRTDDDVATLETSTDQWEPVVTSAYVSTSSFTVATDLTADYETDRRIKLNDSSTLYGVITSSSYSSPNTTVNVTLDSGSLSSSLTTSELSVLTVTNPSIPESLAITKLTKAVTLSGNNTHSGANSFTGVNTFTKSVYTKKGADIASANDMVLLADGNSNNVTGTTQTNGMTDGIQNEIRHFRSIASFLMKHDTAPSSGFSKFFIVQGQADITTEANDEWDGIYDGTVWRVINYNRAVGYAYIKLSDTQTANTQSGDFTSGAWRTRVLNTEDSDTGGNCSLSSNQFTLDTGTYIINARAPGSKVNAHKAVLYNISDGVNEIIGSSAHAEISDNAQSDSIVVGVFNVSSTKIYEIRHRCGTTKTGNGFGISSNISVSEIYTTVELQKIR